MIDENELTLYYAFYKQKNKNGGVVFSTEFSEKTWDDFRGELQNRTLVLYGAGDMAEYFLNVYFDIPVSYIVDGKLKTNEKRRFRELFVYPVEKLKIEEEPLVLLITPVGNIEVMAESAKKLDIKSVYSLAAMEWKRRDVRRGTNHVSKNKGLQAKYQRLWRKKQAEKKERNRIISEQTALRSSITALKKENEGLKKELSMQKKRADGIQQRQSERYRYLLHTNAILNYMIEQHGYEELKREQIAYKFTEIYKNSYEPDFDHPKTFNEKVQAMLLNDPDNELFARVTDKLTLKQYVAEKIGEEYVVPTLGVWNDPEEISFESLPESFVLKATNGGDSMRIIIVRDLENQDIQRMKETMKKWFRIGEQIYFNNFNSTFKHVKQHVFAEPLLGNKEEPLYDVKLWMFHGKAEFYNIPEYFNEQGSFNATPPNSYYKMDGTPFLIKTGIFREGQRRISSALLRKMEIAAEKLAEPFAFVRVDFMVAGDKLYVGELTLTPGAGLKPFDNQEIDSLIGSLWRN